MRGFVNSTKSSPRQCSHREDFGGNRRARFHSALQFAHGLGRRFHRRRNRRRPALGEIATLTLVAKIRVPTT